MTRSADSLVVRRSAVLPRPSNAAVSLSPPSGRFISACERTADYRHVASRLCLSALLSFASRALQRRTLLAVLTHSVLPPRFCASLLSFTSARRCCLIVPPANPTAFDAKWLASRLLPSSPHPFHSCIRNFISTSSSSLSYRLLAAFSFSVSLRSLLLLCLIGCLRRSCICVASLRDCCSCN